MDMDIMVSSSAPQRPYQRSAFDEQEALASLKHYLPAQAPLMDFIHHNTLHSFQDLTFSQALISASATFGYKVFLPITEYRSAFTMGRIGEHVLDQVITEKYDGSVVSSWKEKLLHGIYDMTTQPVIGQTRQLWKEQHHIDLDGAVHPLLFRILSSYLDQGIAMWNFPVWENGFLAAIKEMERISYSSFFKTKKVKNLLLHTSCGITELLPLLIDDPACYKQYLFDQQFAHPGWSGLVSTVESGPQTLLDQRKITLQDLVVLELLLEIDALEYQLKKNWMPLQSGMIREPLKLSKTAEISERDEVLLLWHESYEWSYYNEVLSGLTTSDRANEKSTVKTFQAMFCIDDRECSLRRYLEAADTGCETFGTPGFFGVAFYFQPEHGKFLTKLCPAPVFPAHIIKEHNTHHVRRKELHFTPHATTLFRGVFITATVGFWSAVKLFLNIFRPSLSSAMASSFTHMDHLSQLTIENTTDEKEGNLKIGFTVSEMADRVEGLLKSIGLIKDFAPIVYIIGHGSSSINNPHASAYDCGACSGRPGSVNARVMSYMANQPQVRKILTTRGIAIDEQTMFVGGLHDTTMDELHFYDQGSLTPDTFKLFSAHQITFQHALEKNAKERSRRFESINTKASLKDIHKEVKRRALSIFEPRPELNHATNALCIVGRRALTKNVFLDRRAFLNSYDYSLDLNGNYLTGILNAAAPVCGGINLEYFFSRMDNEKLGAGTKLPHNVIGLYGVANGTDGDLRPGLPSQMIEVHDPVRLLMVVEHFPEVVLQVIKKSAATFEWFKNNWVHLVVIDPVSGKLYRLKADVMVSLQLSVKTPAAHAVADISAIVESSAENLPVCITLQS